MTPLRAPFPVCFAFKAIYKMAAELANRRISKRGAMRCTASECQRRACWAANMKHDHQKQSH
eukprot:4352886-Amphidinium_carterae.1